MLLVMVSWRIGPIMALWLAITYQGWRIGLIMALWLAITFLAGRIGLIMDCYHISSLANKT